MSLTTEQFEELMKTLTQNQNYRTGAWASVIEKARAYALMKTHGVYLDDRGNTCRPHEVDKSTEYYRDELLRAVERAFLEDTLLGNSIPVSAS